MISLTVALLLAAETPGLNQPANVDGCRITLLAVRELSASDLVSKGKQAAGGRRIYWLIEPKEGSSEPPSVGDVRYIVNGKPYNAVTSPTSKQPFAPDVMVRGYEDMAGQVPTPVLPPRPGSVVIDVIVRGAKLDKAAPASAELQLNLGGKKLWHRARTW